jgi:alpha-N-acetylglucosamine transferase
MLIRFQQSQLIHSIYHKYSPAALHNTWTTVGDRNNAYNLRNADLFIPFAINEQLKRLSYFVFPKIWNDLNVMKYTPNPVTFKLFIKNELLIDGN